MAWALWVPAQLSAGVNSVTCLSILGHLKGRSENSLSEFWAVLNFCFSFPVLSFQVHIICGSGGRCWCQGRVDGTQADWMSTFSVQLTSVGLGCPDSRGSCLAQFPKLDEVTRNSTQLSGLWRACPCPDSLPLHDF